MRIAYLGPEGTFTHEALLADLAREGAPRTVNLVPLPTIYDAVLAVHDRAAERALVPMENSLEGSVNATLDALVMETREVDIVGEVVHPIRHCLIARAPLELTRVKTVVSHPQASAQCARFLRAELPQARVLAGSSTADAVRMVAEHDGSWAALGNRLAAERYGCQILRSGVEDDRGNETRFVWLALRGSDRGESAASSGRHKTVIVFWGPGADSPGWLVRCLSEFSEREVNLTRIESRPRKQRLGSYMFFCDLEGRARDPAVAAALSALREHVEELRVLGSFPAFAGA